MLGDEHEGSELLVNNSGRVTRGQEIVRWNPVAVDEAGTSPVCPIAALEAVADALGDVREDGDIKAGDTLLSWQ